MLEAWLSNREITESDFSIGKNGTLPSEYKPHILHGNHEGEWEAHVESDWLLIWEQNDMELTLLMLTTGTHSDLFGKTKR